MARKFFWCSCHHGIPVDVRDPLEAAMASGCKCLPLHTAALADDNGFEPPQPWSPDAAGDDSPWSPDPG